MADSMLSSLKQVCKYHRSKEYYIANLSQEFYLPLQNQDCWCLLTQGVAGPDDKLVSAAGCGPHRKCFRSQIQE